MRKKSLRQSLKVLRHQRKGRPLPDRTRCQPDCQTCIIAICGKAGASTGIARCWRPFVFHHQHRSPVYR